MDKQNNDVSIGEFTGYLFEILSDDEVVKITEIIQVMPDYHKAFLFAVKAHYGQVDKSGNPYILHPLNVSFMVEAEDEKILALLHDVVEDTEYTFDDVAELGFGHLTDALDCLTRRDTETYKEYVVRISENRLATAVKIADLKHNLSRKDNLPENERGIKDRYMKWLPFLEERLKEFDEKKRWLD